MSCFKNIFENKKVFVAYITAGHRGLAYTKEAALALVAGGVDILEIGVPFSDPVADGPAIQTAMSDALNHQTNIKDVIALIGQIKQQVEIPVILFTYYNPLFIHNVGTTLQQAASAGVEGILVVDLPFEESATYFEACEQTGIAPVCLISPSTEKNRISLITQNCNAFIYYVCRNGITGVKNALPENYATNVAAIKSQTRLPVVSGFGIGNRSLADEAIQHADGFVVGSAFVKAISDGASPSDLKALAEAIAPI